MEDLDGGVRGVDVLAARTAGAADLDAEIFHPHVHIDLLRLGKDGDGDRGGVDAALRFSRRDALHAVDAGLVFHVAEDLVAGDFQDHFLETADFRRRAFEVLRLPALGIRIALVEAHDFGSE